MSALADALTAAQSRALSALQKQYAACKLEQDEFRDKLGAALPSEPATSNGKPKDEPATDAQLALVKRLCGEKGQPVPDPPLTKAQAHEVIDTLKAGTYDAGRWSVPF